MSETEDIARLEEKVDNLIKAVDTLNRNLAGYPRVEERVAWLTQFFWIIAGGTLTSLIGLLFLYLSGK